MIRFGTSSDQNLRVVTLLATGDQCHLRHDSMFQTNHLPLLASFLHLKQVSFPSLKNTSQGPYHGLIILDWALDLEWKRQFPKLNPSESIHATVLQERAKSHAAALDSGS